MPKGKPKPPDKTDKAKQLEVRQQEEWSRKSGNIPFVSTLAIRAYIEKEAAPLRKVIMLANGQPIPKFDEHGKVIGSITPTWEDQKDAIYKLLPRVAPELRSVEVQYDDGSGKNSEQQADLLESICEGLNQLAHAKRSGQPLPVAFSDDKGSEEMAGPSKTKAAPTRR